MNRKNIGIFSILFFLFVAFTPAIYAVGYGQVGQRAPTGQMTACQAKESALKKRMEQLTQLATTMQEKFSTISMRVEQYYSAKVLPGGKTVNNYSELVADIQAKKAAVHSAVTTAQTDTTNFTCNTGPKEQLTQFRYDMQAVKTALKNYRTSIKNLIVAVRSVTGAMERSGTASPASEKKEGMSNL